MTLDMPPRELAMYLSHGKAESVANRHSNAVILAADSFAVFEGALLGKPHTVERAIEMLTMLNGKRHEFITGYTLIDTVSGQTISNSSVTNVYFRKVSDQEIKDYVATEDVLEKAGGYILQQRGALLLKHLDGEPYNVQGLPIGSVGRHLQKLGIRLYS